MALLISSKRLFMEKNNLTYYNHLGDHRDFLLWHASFSQEFGHLNYRFMCLVYKNLLRRGAYDHGY